MSVSEYKLCNSGGIDMRTNKYELDMTKGPILKNVLRFAVPYMLTMFLQLFYNAADLVVVSRWSGSNAMASVGATSAVTNLLLNLFLGMSVGSSVLLARCYGAHDDKKMHKAVHTTIMFALVLGVASVVVGQLLCRPILVLMDTPAGKVLDGAVLYMRIIFIGTPATILYNFGASILRAVGDTKRPLYILSVSGIVNVSLNLVFVICFDMGVAGVATATIISKYVSASWVMITLLKTNGSYKIILSKLRIYKYELITIVKIGFPAGLQNTVLSFSNAILQSATNSFGAAAMAGCSAASNIETFAYSVKDAFRQATVTAVSQNYGARNEKRMNKCFAVCVACMLVGCFLLAIGMSVFRKQLLGIYITDSELAMQYGNTRMLITALPYFLSGIMDIYAGYLRGLGHSGKTTINSFVGICGLRILWAWVIFPLSGNFAVLYICWPVSWVVTSIMNMITLHAVKKKLDFSK